MSLLSFFPVVLLAPGLFAQQPVDVTKVVSRRVERTLTLPGEILPYLKVDLHARVTGFVERVEVDRGSVVKEGQLLVVLSAPELAAQRAEAEAKVQTLESQRAEAQARLVAAESTYERLKAASATPGVVAENELIVAGKAVDAARSVVQALDSSGRAAQDSARALRELEGYLRITAPFSGVITERLAHPGALAGPGAGSSSMPLLRLEQKSRLRLVVAVPEGDVSGIIKGAHVRFTVPAYPGESFGGVVARISDSLDQKTRTMAVEVDVQNADGRLSSGMYPQVEWPVRRSRPSLLVPPASIVRTTERTFVIRVRDGRAGWVDVARGAPAGDLVEVNGALQAGDVIVARGSDEIREGAALDVRLGAAQP